MKFLMPLLLASACLAISEHTQDGVEDLVKRIAEPESLPEAAPAEDGAKAAARCRGGDYGKGPKGKKKCLSNCGKGKPGQCTQVSNPGLGFTWFCTCPAPKRALDDHPGAAEFLAKRMTEAEPELVPGPDSSPAENAILESRADIEARARCVPGSYGSKKKSCTSKCKGKGKCSRASSPGVGFVWNCTCPNARRDTLLDTPAGVEDLAKRIAEPVVEARFAEPVPEPVEDSASAEDSVLEAREEVEERAVCRPATFQKRKRCEANCKGKGQCRYIFGPGITSWDCICR